MFYYNNNFLYVDDLQVAEIAKHVGTPFYLYSISQLKENFKSYVNAFSNSNVLICYAVKANSNLTLLKVLSTLGSGADCVSQGEIRKSLIAGISPGKIVFAGVGKSEEDLIYALQNDILNFNVESIPELLLLNQVALRLNKTANIAIRINANIDSKTHAKINTGLKSNKFGIDVAQIPGIAVALRDLKGVNLRGLAIHIGSQITSLSPYREAYHTLLEQADLIRSLNCNIEYLDLGGGLGISYDQENPPTIYQYAQLVNEMFHNKPYKLIIEPGRSMVADIGILVTSVIYVKDTLEKTFLIVDAGMNDILRPSLYDAYHEIIPLTIRTNSTIVYDVVGPVCETSDIFAKDRKLPTQQAGDFLAFRHAGAYGAVMSSSYNSRLMIPEVVAQNGRFGIAKLRQSYEDMLKVETIPTWL